MTGELPIGPRGDGPPRRSGEGDDVETCAPGVVVVAASRGGLAVLMDLVRALPEPYAAAVVVVLHRKALPKNHLSNLLARLTRLETLAVREGAPVRPGVVYVAPAHQHVTITKARRFALVDGRRLEHVLSSANPLFESAARAYGSRVLGLVLSGEGRDGADGARAIAAAGGTVLVQDPATAAAPAMPTNALATGAVRGALPVEALADAIARQAETWAHEARSPRA